MAITYVTKQAISITTTEVTIYTVPAVTVSKLVTIIIANRGAVQGTYRLSQAVGGGATQTKDYISYDITLGANSTDMITSPIFGNTGDKFILYASNGNFTVSIHAQENS